MATVNAPQAVQRATPKGKTLSELGVMTTGRNLPSRLLLHGSEGVGKTSFPASARDPFYIQTRGETGLETLIDTGQLPELPHLPEIVTWTDLLAAVEALTVEDHPHKALVIDTLNGAERLCHEHVCATKYANNWGKDGFTSYQQGYDVALADWRELLVALDRLRETKRMSIVGLCHTRVRTFKNPEGADYDRYEADMHQKTWGLTHKWADIVLFYTYETIVTEANPEKKGKGRGGQRRVLYTQRCAAWDAKNRHGLPECIDAGNSHQEAWTNFITAIKAAKAAGKDGRA